MEFIKVIPKKIDKKDYSLLVKHNNLIQGKYYLEASEQKLLYKIFEKIQKKSYTTRIVQINFQDFYNDYKSVLTKNITKKDFKNLIESLQDKKPYIIKGDEYIRTQWYKIYGKVDLSEVKLELDIDVFEYVQSLDKNFTGLRLETLYAFKSFHSMRIYELLKQWCETRTEIPYTVDSLKELLGIEDNAGYKNFFNLIDCQYKCNTLYLCCIKDLCRCFISETLAGSIIYYSNNSIKLFLTYRRKIKPFRIKLS